MEINNKVWYSGSRTALRGLSVQAERVYGRETIGKVECRGVNGTTTQSDYALGWLVGSRPINKLVQDYDEPDYSRDLD
jgi:hypothetical protein